MTRRQHDAGHAKNGGQKMPRPQLDLRRMIEQGKMSPDVAGRMFGGDFDVMRSYAAEVPDSLAKIAEQVAGLHAAFEKALRECPDVETARRFAAMHAENTKNALRFLAWLREPGEVADVEAEIDGPHL